MEVLGDMRGSATTHLPGLEDCPAGEMTPNMNLATHSAAQVSIQIIHGYYSYGYSYEDKYSCNSQYTEQHHNVLIDYHNMKYPRTMHGDICTHTLIQTAITSFEM